MWELYFLLVGQYVRPTGGPHAYEVIYELPAGKPVLLQEQFDHALSLLLNLFVSFAHNAVVFDDFECLRCRWNNLYLSDVGTTSVTDRFDGGLTVTVETLLLS